MSGDRPYNGDGERPRRNYQGRDQGREARERSELGDRVPPHNLEAERSLLGAILLENNAIYEVADVITPDDFYREVNQVLFRTYLSLSEDKEPIDLTTLRNRLNNDKAYESAGGALYLSEILQDVPTAANVRHYAKIVKEKAIIRRLVSTAQEIARDGLGDVPQVEDFIAEAERRIFEVAQDKLRQPFRPIRDLLKDTFSAIEKRFEMRRQMSRDAVFVTGVSTGFEALDRLTAGFQKGDLIILAARPSMGKTALSLNFAQNAALRGQKREGVLVCSLEMGATQLVERLIASEARIKAGQIRVGDLTPDDFSKLMATAARVQKAALYIDDTPALSVTEVRAKARRLAAEQPLGMIMIDYLQLMRGKPSAAKEGREREISDISRGLKALAKEMEVPVIALSQLNRSLESRADKRPQLSDLRESGAIEQDADVIMFIYRDEYYNKDTADQGIAEVIIAKQRNGPTDTVRLKFFAEYTRFDNLLEEGSGGDRPSTVPAPYEEESPF